MAVTNTQVKNARPEARPDHLVIRGLDVFSFAEQSIL